MKKQQIMILVALLTVVLSVSACGCLGGGAEKKAHKSQAAVNEEKLELSEKYQKCMKKAGDDQEKQAQCEQYLKASEPLK
jgi:hypothetical protein